MLRPLVPQLLEKEKALTELLRAGRAASRPKTRGVRPHELRSLLLHLRLGLLQALLDRAELLPKHSPDRTSSLLEAERCAKRLDSGVLSSAAKWDRDLLLARVYRLQGRYREAERILQALEARQPSRLGSDQVLAEKARLLIDQDRVPDAADLLAARHRSGPRMPGELQFLFVRCLVVLWQAAREKHQAALAEQLRQHITLLIEQADASDPYWADRCRRLLDRVDTTGRLGERLATMIERAKGAFASGDMQGAAAAYREAAEAAREEGRTDVAGDLIYTAASIELKRGHYEQAAAVLAGFPSRFPAHRRAAEAHLLSAFALAKLYQQAVAAGKRNEAAKLRRQYADALERHREKFHGHPTWAEATWMLAVLNESEGQYEEALSLYGQIPSSDRRVADAEVGIARCYEAIVETLRRQHQPDDQWRRSAIAHLERFAGRFPPEPQPLSVQQAEVAVRLAQLLAGGRPPEFRRADRLLERAIASLRRHVARARPSDNGSNGATEATGERSEEERPGRVEPAARLLHRAIQLRIVSLAARRQWDQAQELLLSLPMKRAADLLPVLDGLSELAVASGEAVRQGLGQLQLTATGRLLKSKPALTATQQDRLVRCRAQGFAATGNLREAIKLYEQLLRRRPEDVPLVRTLAQLCLECGTTGCLEKAKTYWRLLEGRAVPGSPDWMDARYHVAECCYKLRQFELCRKLLSVTRLLYGLPREETLRRKFQQLETAVQAASKKRQ